MKLIYTNKTVEKQCTELRRAKKDFSDKVALKLHQLINLLEVSDSGAGGSFYYRSGPADQGDFEWR